MASWCYRCLLWRHSLLCHDNIFLYSTYICVATHFVISRPDFSSLCWNLYCDIKKSIMTLFICVQLISVSRLYDPCRDIKTSLQLEVCHNVEFFCCDQVSSLSKHHMSRPCFSVTTRVSSYFSVATYTTLSRQKSFFEVLLLS